MKKCAFILLAFICTPLSVLASEKQVTVEWLNPDEYRDVKATSGSRIRFKKETFSQIEEYLTRLAKSLPDSYKLIFKVTELDLAGQVWPAAFAGFGSSATDIRVIKGVDIPRMHFSYVLTKGHDQLIQKNEVKLKDMAFLQRSNKFFSSESLRYEKSMLRNWFNTEFANQLSKGN